MNKLQFLLNNFQGELNTLENKLGNIFNIPITTIADNLTDVTITCNPDITTNISFIKQLQLNSLTKTQIWTSQRFKYQFNGCITEIGINKDNINQDLISNGEDCQIITCFGQTKINSSSGPNMFLKFRNLDFKNPIRIEQLNEVAVHNAVIIEQLENVRDLFAQLYCMFKLNIPQDGVNQRWECIGTEILENINKTIYNDPNIFYGCFMCLKELHSLGFIHGDSHWGNFMFSNKKNKVIMIDTDRFEKLPTHNPTLSKYLQILDYLQLLYWNNLFLSVYKTSENNEYKISRDLYTNHIQFTFLHPPMGFIQHKAAIESIIMNELKSPLSTKTFNNSNGTRFNLTYWDFLSSKTEQEINIFFEGVFKLSSQMKTYNQHMIDSLNSYRNSILPHQVIEPQVLIPRVTIPQVPLPQQPIVIPNHFPLHPFQPPQSKLHPFQPPPFQPPPFQPPPFQPPPFQPPPFQPPPFQPPPFQQHHFLPQPPFR